MIIVTGAARSRTSMTMGILNAFGHEFVGEKFIDKKFEQKHNLNGIYEKKHDTILGYKGPNGNQAIKILLSALFPNKFNNMKGSSKEILKNSVTLMCLRKPYEIAKSVKKVYPNLPVSPSYTIWEYCSFLSWLDYNRWFMDNLYLIDTDDYFKEPKDTIIAIGNIIGVPAGDKGLEKAIKLIDPRQTISSDSHVWDKKFEYEGSIVDSIYECFLINDFENAMKIASDYINNRGK